VSRMKLRWVLDCWVFRKHRYSYRGEMPRMRKTGQGRHSEETGNEVSNEAGNKTLKTRRKTDECY